MQRIDSGEIMQIPGNELQPRASYSNGHINGSANLTPRRPAPRAPGKTSSSTQSQGSLMSLLICAGGIYVSFLTWGLLQERINTTPYAIEPSTFFPGHEKHEKGAPAVEYFRYAVFVNTIQALFAFISGSAYLFLSTGRYKLLPSRAALWPLLGISLTTTLASPFGYASLAHVDYLTFVLAKSCKLLPVMALHVTLYNKRYPLSKYLIVFAVTAGVAIFTLYHPPKAGKSSSKNAAKSSYWGLFLLGINLMFDGLTNTTQDLLFKSPERYGVVKGPQMMVSSNFVGVLLQVGYLLVMPFVPRVLVPAFVPESARTELFSAIAFIQRHPAVLYDVLGFCAAGAIGQIFIFSLLERFNSLWLVMVTVTRKMLTMVLSVVWYGKTLTRPQWGGVALVFAALGAEAWLTKKEKEAKEAKSKELKSR